MRPRFPNGLIQIAVLLLVIVAAAAALFATVSASTRGQQPAPPR